MPIPDRADESASLSRSSAEPLTPVGGLQELDGQFAFMTTPKDTFLTAVGGGGRTTDTIHRRDRAAFMGDVPAVVHERLRVLRDPDSQRPFRHRRRRRRTDDGHDSH